MARCKRFGDLIVITKFESTLPAGRQRGFALGRHYADAAAQIRERGLPAALELVATMGGVVHAKAIAKGLLNRVMAEVDVPPYRIVKESSRRFEDGAEVQLNVVMVPQMSWYWLGDYQRGELRWMPIAVVMDRGSAPALVRPLPQ
jgi:hypothetical protein